VVARGVTAAWRTTSLRRSTTKGGTKGAALDSAVAQLPSRPGCLSWPCCQSIAGGGDHGGAGLRGMDVSHKVQSPGETLDPQISRWWRS
jgi:hypothetical protein